MAFAFGDPASSGDNEIVAAQTGSTRIRVQAVHLMSTGTVDARFRSATNSKTGLFKLTAGLTVLMPFNPEGWFETNGAEALNLNLSTTVGVATVVVWIPV